MFHAYTGWDTVSSPSSNLKWKEKSMGLLEGTIGSHNEVTTNFGALSAGPNDVTNKDV